MAIAVSPLNGIPEKYTATRFKSDCWFHIANQYRKTGRWMSFGEYQKVGDKTCRESVFKQVLADMRLDVLIGSKDAIQGPTEVPEPVQAKPPEAPPEKPTVMAQALITGLDKTAKTAKPVTIEVRVAAEAIIRENPHITYAEFKKEYPHPGLDHAYWEKMTTLYLERLKENEDMAKAKTRNGPKMSDGRQRIRQYLESLSPENFSATTFKVYLAKSGHKNADRIQFQNERMRIMKIMAEGGKKVKPAKYARAAALPQAPAIPGKRFDTLAEISLADFPKIDTKTLIQVATELTRALHPRGDGAKIVMLADPPVLEIRLPV